MASLVHPTRLTILRELAKEPMGPPEVQRRHPHLSLPFVRGHFRALEKLGYIERDPNYRGRGSLYRPCSARVLFDRSSLEELGDASGHFTAAVCLNYVERIAQAFDASTFSARADSRFTWTVLYLDEERWRRAVSAADSLFWYSLLVRKRAADRLATSGDAPIPATTGFCCIASPESSEGIPVIPPMAYEVAIGQYHSGSLTVSQNLARALTHPVRGRILHELARQPLSPVQLSGACSIPVETIWKHCRRLEEFGCIECLKRRSAVSDHNVFALLPHSLFDASTYGAFPPSIRLDVDCLTVSSYVERIADSILAGTIKDRLDSHLTWTGLHLDEQGWTELVPAVDAVFRFILFLQRHVPPRADTSDLIPVTLGFSCFQSPEGSPVIADDKVDGLYGGEEADRRKQQLDWVEKLAMKLGHAQGG
jgi:DNA-binding transcriptional ArsR family regulator